MAFEWLPERLRSRKFWVAVSGVIAIALGLPPESVGAILLVIIAYILGQSYVDAKNGE